MKFRRNVFYPIRLIMYPICITTLAVFYSGMFVQSVLTILNAISLILLVEAIYEFIVPYAEWHDDQIVINSSIIHKTRIDLSLFTEKDVEFETWFIKIGPNYVSLRRFRRGYRERFEEAIEKYFQAKLYGDDSAIKSVQNNSSI